MLRKCQCRDQGFLVFFILFDLGFFLFVMFHDIERMFLRHHRKKQ